MKNFGVYCKRTFFFIATNIVITSTLFAVGSFAMHYFGIEVQGFSFYVIFYSLFGMGGAFISLWMSKGVAVRAMGVQLIDKKNPSKPEYLQLIEKVHHIANKAGLPAQPDVGVYECGEINAFATGPSKKNSLVAVSTALLEQMNEEEVEGVLAHEVAHIANGDMVTMSLVQGVVNTMVWILASILTQVFVSTVMRGRRSFFMEIMLRQLFASLLYIPGSMVVSFFSRWREFRADHGGAKLAGKGKMIAALRSLQQYSEAHAMQIRRESQQSAQYNYFKINTGKTSAWKRLFSSHPPIENRIRRLQYSVL